MNIPNIHTNLIWDLTVLFLLLTIGYLAILFLLKNNIQINWNNREEKKKHLRGIICELLLYEQGKLKEKNREHIDLKVELWKLLRRSSNKGILSKVLMEVYHELDEGAKLIILRLSKEFGIPVNTNGNLEQSDIDINGNTIPQKDTPGNADHLQDTESKMGVSKTKQPLNNKSKKFQTKTDLLKGEELDLSFVPLVTNTKSPNASPEIQEALMISNDLEFLSECLGKESFERNPYEAIYEEIYGETKIPLNNKPERKGDSFLSIDFLPLIREMEEEKVDLDPITDINDLEVDYEVVIDPHLKKQISDILTSHVEEQNTIVTINEDDKLLDLGEMDLPAARFYTDREFKKVKLLHSIAEMGDIREVPLLNEMLDEEKNDSIANLIKEIISKFLSDYPLYIDEKLNDNKIVDFGEHYVFNHLFSSLDRESQLLLLQEMQQIGDLSDLHFLATLRNHSDSTIREKAKLVSLYIETKLQAIPISDVEVISGHKLDLKKEITEPTKLQLDPAIDFEVATSGFISSKSSSMEAFVNDSTTFFDQGATPMDGDGENFGSNDLFNINFDITPSENITFHNNSAGVPNGKESLEELEAMKFLDQLKELTNKIFKK